MRNPRFAQELKEIERAHPQRRSSFKMAWLYATGQVLFFLVYFLSS